MKRVQIGKTQVGDIILTASHSKAGKAIRASTGAVVSHAIICVQYGSIIDSTADGVQSRNLQREFFEDDEEIYVFRLRDPVPPHLMSKIVDYARSQIGARYSIPEAVRSVASVRKPRGRRQYCSRLIAQAYRHAGISLVPDQDYCAPEDLRKSPLLVELPDMTEYLSEEEAQGWRAGAGALDRQKEAQNAVLSAVRRLDGSVETFEDVDRVVEQHPEWDEEIAQAYLSSGYLDLWREMVGRHPWRYDLRLALALDPDLASDIRAYCVETIREYHTGGERFAVMLAYYQAAQERTPRVSRAHLVELYRSLVRLENSRRSVARAWLLRHHPDDVAQFIQRVEPHSESWFAIVDRVEPMLGLMARASIEATGSLEVCSSCGDTPAKDLRIVNEADAMPGVPSLRLCGDCAGIRRGWGELLEPVD